MILDLDLRPDVHTDGVIAVVGAGAAGIALALSLAEAGRPVLLLEAGGDLSDDDHSPSSAVPGDPAAAVPVANGPTHGWERPLRLDQGRASGLGGTAELWHGQCTRLHDEDVTPRPWLGNLAWPLPAGDLAAAYHEAERWFELSGRGYGAPRWDEYPQLRPPAWATDRLRHDFTEYAPHYLLGQRFRRQLADSTAVQLLVHARVGRIELDAHGKVAALTVLDSRLVPTRLDVPNVVLAAGAIENARLLQLSDPAGIGLGTGRWHTGRWLQDHPVVRLGEVLPTDATRLQDCYTGLHGPGGRLFPKIRLAPELQAAEQLLDATAILNHEVDLAPVQALRRLARRPGRTSADAGPNGQQFRSDVTMVLRHARPMARAVWRRYRRGLSSGLAAEHVWLDVWLEQQPSADSRVTLSTTQRAADGLPAAEVTWHVGELERRTSRRLAQTVAEELGRLQLASVRALPASTDDHAWRASVIDSFHPAGTTRMSADPTAGVVDPDLGVHGVPGLSVVGSSVFPTSGYANPTLTIVALALRLAGHLSRLEYVAA